MRFIREMWNAARRPESELAMDHAAVRRAERTEPSHC